MYMKISLISSYTVNKLWGKSHKTLDPNTTNSICLKKPPQMHKPGPQKSRHRK